MIHECDHRSYPCDYRSNYSGTEDGAFNYTSLNVCFTLLPWDQDKPGYCLVGGVHGPYEDDISAVRNLIYFLTESWKNVQYWELSVQEPEALRMTAVAGIAEADIRKAYRRKTDLYCNASWDSLRPQKPA